MTFTPFGNLQNPNYQCGESYYDVRSGLLQSDTMLSGVGWILPFPKRPGWVVALGFGLAGDGDMLLSRTDFAPYGLAATRHTPYLLELEAEVSGTRLLQRYWLGEAERLCASAVVTGSSARRPVLLVRAWRPGGAIRYSITGEQSPSEQSQRSITFMREDDTRYRTPPVTVVYEGCASVAANTLDELRTLLGSQQAGEGASFEPSYDAESELVAAVPFSGTAATVAAVLGETTTPIQLQSPADGVAVYGITAEQAATQFEESLPQLRGDFPATVKHGFHYDFETTRLCTLPAHGIFDGPWPTWMSSMPRAVLAEGSMDLSRLGYADSHTAQAAVLTMLRDTPGENTPCVFASGGYNMVASDGTNCGTSPAWCIPFFHFYDLFLREPDTDWLSAVYPHLAKLIDYWLHERTDEEGWLTYKCTWEAGEDNNPRIDPLATGDNVISAYVRPVELQASLSHAAMIMKRFAARLGRPDDAERYVALEQEYQSRVQDLWDANTGRFRDWDKTAGGFVAVAGREDYWGADFTRQSPLSLIALLFNTATSSQRKLMRKEILGFFRSPFTIWPSWSTFVLEAARNCGMRELGGEMAYEISRRVYAATDRRTIDEFERPLPGAAPEYWPHDWNEFGGNDAYAWGAQGATFLIRHVLGIAASEEISGLGLVLCPAIPQMLRAEGEKFGVSNLAHRGLRISVLYEVVSGAQLRCTLGLSEARKATLVRESGGSELWEQASEHSFSITNCESVHIH